MVLTKMTTKITPYHFIQVKRQTHNIGKDAYLKATQKKETDANHNLVITAYKGNFTRSEIEDMVYAQVGKLKKKGFKGLASVNLKYPSHWKPGKFFGFREDDYIDIPSLQEYCMCNPGECDCPQDPDMYPEFSISYIPLPSPKGGDDVYNDCLYNALSKSVPAMPWNSPAELKQWLGIHRTDPIHKKYIPNIEHYLKNYKINLSGDHIVPSIKRAPYVIMLTLNDGHYDLLPKPIKYKWETIKEPLDISVYKYTDNNMTHVRALFQGKLGTFPKGKYFMSQQFHKIPQTTVGKKQLTLRETYEHFISYADEIKKLTNGDIDFYKTLSIHDTALDYFYRKTGDKIPVEPIEPDEAHWIDQASAGAIIHSVKDYDGPAYKFDFVSHYPAIMSDTRSIFPIKRGEFSIMTTEEFNKSTFLSVGIYRFKVFNPNNNRLFRCNRNNYYTHTDFLLATKIGLKMEIIQDNKANALTYTSDQCIKGHQMFGDYVSTLYPLKNKKIETAKLLLNILWGSLVEANKTKQRFTPGESIRIPENSTIVQTCHMNFGNKHEIHTQDNTVYFKHDFARIKPFILSKGRYKISTTILPYAGDLLFCHTDSMILSKRPDIKTGTGLGDLRDEGYCESLNINKSAKCSGVFK